MTSRWKIFLVCFFGALAFAVCILLTHHLIGSDSHAYASPLAGVMVLSWCNLAAAIAARFFLAQEQQGDHLRRQLMRVFAHLRTAEEESARLKASFAQMTPLLQELTRRLHGLEQKSGEKHVLAAGQYASAEPNGDETWRQALEQLGDELDQAETAMRGLATSAQSLEQSLHPLATRTGQAAKTLGELDGLAGRLNRLALNALLEACRLGEQGEAFGQIAGEVRTLARETTAQVALLGEQLRQVSDTVAATSAPISSLLTDAAAIERHLVEAGELLDAQWQVATARPSPMAWRRRSLRWPGRPPASRIESAACPSRSRTPHEPAAACRHRLPSNSLISTLSAQAILCNSSKPMSFLPSS